MNQCMLIVNTARGTTYARSTMTVVINLQVLLHEHMDTYRGYLRTGK